MTKLIIAFRNFANAPKKHEIYTYNVQESQRVTLHKFHIYKWQTESQINVCNCKHMC
jgi:hypothetical protein